MPYQDYISLTKEQKRNLPTPDDVIIQTSHHEPLKIRDGQSRFKLKSHGHLFNLPRPFNQKGAPITLSKDEIDENNKAFKHGIRTFAQKNDLIWIEDGTYQGGTEREVPSINIYDPKTKLILIFKQKDRNFVTTCKLNPIEEDRFLKTKNFGGSNFNYGGTPVTQQDIVGNINLKSLNKNEL